MAWQFTDQSPVRESSSESRSEDAPPNNVATEPDTHNGAEGSPGPDYRTLRILLHEILHKEIRTELFKNYRVEQTEIEPHDFNQALKFQPLFRLNTRRDYNMNRFQIILRDGPENDNYAKMESDLNKTYNEVRKHRLTELSFPPSLIPKCGTFIVVLDTYKDHIGRFKRAKIVKSRGKLKDGVICHLIDEGVTTTFPNDRVYVILKAFLQVPPKTLTIQLAELKSLSGSPTFGRVLETCLEHLAGHDLVVIPVLENYQIGSKVVQEPLQVQLYSSEMNCSVNEVIATDVAGSNCYQGNKEKLLRGDVFQNGIISHFTMDGHVWIRFKTRIQNLIRDHLKNIFDSWSSFSLFRHESQDVKLLEGQVCLAIHPQKRKLLRCEVLPGSSNGVIGTDLKMIHVLWIDYGDEGDLLAGDLLPTHSLSKVLRESKPLAKEFQLVDIKYLTSNYLQTLVTARTEVTVRIMEVPSLSSFSRRSDQLPLVQLLVTEFKRSESAVRVSKSCINHKLLKKGLAESNFNQSTFVARTTVEPHGLCKLSMQYPSTVWVHDYPVDDETLTKRSPISFYVSKILGDKFIIHPWSTKFALEILQMKLMNFYENVEWIKKERADNELKYPPYGQFCAYTSKDGHWHRAKILRKIHKEVGPCLNAEKYLENSLLELLLIDQATVVTAEYSSLWRLAPLELVMILGPQGAIGRLKTDRDTSSGLPGSASRHPMIIKTQLEGILGQLGERHYAILEDIDTDNDGRAIMSLSAINCSSYSEH